jgi:rubredoxin
MDPKDMFICRNPWCGYIYNPDKGDPNGKVAKGTRFEELPEKWKCPVCGENKKSFRSMI